MHVVLHVYPVTRDLGTALIVCEAVVAAELRDDRIQIEEALTIYNLGRTAWQPDDVRMALPEGFTAFNAQATMSDQGVDEAGGAAKLRGTFPPGRHAIEFRWQLPWSGEKDVDFDVGLPPHVAIARVMMPANANDQIEGDRLPRAGAPARRARAVVSRDRATAAARRREAHVALDRDPRSADARPGAPHRHACWRPAPSARGWSSPAPGASSAAGRGSVMRRSRATRSSRSWSGSSEHTHRDRWDPETYERARRELLEALAYTL